ncbi:MAG TPA: sensor histidine kinase [Candidatus Dormibacteraeota bacterium]
MLTRRRLELWGRIFMLAWLLFFLTIVVDLFYLPIGRSERIGSVAAVLGFMVVWAWFWLRVAGRGNRTASTLAVGLLILIVALLALASPVNTGLSMAVFIGIVAAAAFRWKSALVLIVGLALGGLLIDAVKGPHWATTINLALNVVIIGAAAVGIRQGIASHLQLQAAREEIARLAVAEERLRFARDLHDLLGQSLAMIVLKSEVVARRLPPEAGELRDEILEVVDAARKALDEVREAVAGYRLPKLEEELATAQSALRTAGIASSYENLAGRLTPSEEAVLGWAVREAVTNVIRHSGARRCRIELHREAASVHLEVVDDGRGGSAMIPGSGLRGIRERAEAMGGDAEAGATREGFHTRVRLPANPLATTLEARS